MTYTPNFNDPRVISKAKRALGFSLGVLNETKPHPWSTRYLDRYFGQSQHQLSKWLRNQLLITTNDHWNKDTGVCKEYILNKTGCDYVESLIETRNLNNYITIPYCITSREDAVKQWCRDEFKKEFTTKEFEYEFKSNRYWHPLQNVRSQYRKEVLAEINFKYQYDIDCCAPTLIMYHAHCLGMSEYLFAMRSYLKRKDTIRSMLARDLEIPVEVAKRIINSLFAGAKIANIDTNSIFNLLDNDLARLIALREHHYIIQLREEIKLCWDYIEEHYEKRYIITKKGTQKRQRMNSKRKWGVYFQLEQQVMNVVRTYLDSNNKCFLEHDGWTCENLVNTSELETIIKRETNFTVKLQFD
jgi:hypothetical protein